MEPLSELPVGGCSDVWERAGRALRQGRKQEDLSGWTDWPCGASGSPGACAWGRRAVSLVFLLLCEWRAPASSATARNITSSVAEQGVARWSHEPSGAGFSGFPHPSWRATCQEPVAHQTLSSWSCLSSDIWVSISLSFSLVLTYPLYTSHFMYPECGLVLVFIPSHEHTGFPRPSSTFHIHLVMRKCVLWVYCSVPAALYVGGLFVLNF